MALLVFGVTGCAAGAASGRAAESATAGAENPTPAAGTTTPAAGGACDVYVAKACAKAGEASAVCAATRQKAKSMAPSACQTAIAESSFSADALEKAGAACKKLAAWLCKDLGPDTQSCSMVMEQTPTFPEGRCDTMLQKYGEVLAELQAREARRKPLSPVQRTALESGSPLSFGPADAKVTLVVFTDFQCPYCARAETSLAAVRQRHPDDVRIVYRQFPLTFHTQARLAAEAALAAGEQGKFAEYRDLLFAHQKALERPELVGYAKELGLDLRRFNEALDTRKYASTVDADLALGELALVNGTPTLFVNGLRLDNAVDADQVLRAVDAARR